MFLISNNNLGGVLGGAMTRAANRIITEGQDYLHNEVEKVGKVTRTCIKKIGKNLGLGNLVDYRSKQKMKKEQLIENKRRQREAMDKRTHPYMSQEENYFYFPNWEHVLSYAQSFSNITEALDVLRSKGKGAGDFVLLESYNKPGCLEVFYLDEDLNPQEMQIIDPTHPWFFEAQYQSFYDEEKASKELVARGEKQGDFVLLSTFESGQSVVHALYLDDKFEVQQYRFDPAIQSPLKQQIISSEQRKEVYSRVVTLSAQLGFLKNVIVQNESFSSDTIQNSIKGSHYALLLQWMPNDDKGKLFSIEKEAFIQDFLEWIRYHPEKPSIHIPYLLKTFGHYFSLDVTYDFPMQETHPLLADMHRIAYTGYAPNRAINVIREDLKTYFKISILDDSKKNKIDKMFQNIVISKDIVSMEQIEKLIPKLMDLLNQGIPVAVLVSTDEPSHLVGCIFNKEKMMFINFGYGSFEIETDDCKTEVGLREYKIDKKSITYNMLIELLSIHTTQELPNQDNNFSNSKLQSIFDLQLLNIVGGGTPQKARNCTFKSSTCTYKAGLHLIGASEEEIIFEHQNFMANNREIWLDHVFDAIRNVKSREYETQLLFSLMLLTYKIKQKQMIVKLKKEQDLFWLDKIENFVKEMKKRDNPHHYLDKILEFISGNITTERLTGVHQAALEFQRDKANNFHEKWSQKAKLHQRLYQILNQTMDSVRDKAAGWMNEQFDTFTNGVLQLCASNLQGRARQITE